MLNNVYTIVSRIDGEFVSCYESLDAASAALVQYAFNGITHYVIVLE